MGLHIHDLENAALLGNSIHATISTDTSTVGTAVDCLLSDGPIHAIISTGNCGDASTSFYVKLTECATSGGSYTDISGALSATYTGATLGDNLALAVSTPYRSLRYVKAVVVTSGGGTPSVPIAVTILGRKKISGTGTGYVSV